MTRRISVKKLVRAEKLSGEIARLFRRWSSGIIHGDDGFDVAFNFLSTEGVSYSDLCLGQRVSYRLHFPKDGKVPVATHVQPSVEQSTNSHDGEKKELEPEDLEPRVV
jgi:hypothetical protein